jgi:uncharacterized membrane protein
METFTALKLLHGAATLLLFVCAVTLLVVAVRRWRAGDKNLAGGVVQRPWSFVWALMGLCLLALPVSGWFLVHLAGWPLSQMWLLVRLNRLRLGRVARYPWFTLGLAIFCAVCFIAIAGLMGAKPV